MSAKKPWFKARLGWADPDAVKGDEMMRGHTTVFHDSPRIYESKVRITDARELTAEKAVQKVLARVDGIFCVKMQRGDAFVLARELAKASGMTATVKNGKVTVRKVKR